jgi:hypothetical protein
MPGDWDMDADEIAERFEHSSGLEPSSSCTTGGRPDEPPELSAPGPARRRSRRRELILEDMSRLGLRP